jgi:signal peptidase I
MKKKLFPQFSGRGRHSPPREEDDLAGMANGPPSQDDPPVGPGESPTPVGGETPEARGEAPWRSVAYVAAKLVLVVGIVWLMFSQVFALAQMKGEDMYPRLRDGDLIVAYRMERDYAQDDVVLFEKNGYQRVARIVAQGGDVVNITEDGSLVINGHVEDEEIFYLTEPVEDAITYPYTVPEGSYFVLCDFRTSCVDSRYFGAVSQDELTGKVITILRRRGI